MSALFLYLVLAKRRYTSNPPSFENSLLWVSVLLPLVRQERDKASPHSFWSIGVYRS